MEGMSFEPLDRQRRNIYEVSITTELGCSFGNGEFYSEIINIKQGVVGEDDWQLVKECIAIEMSEESLPKEGSTIVTVYESGEWQDLHWCKYYSLLEE